LEERSDGSSTITRIGANSDKNQSTGKEGEDESLTGDMPGVTIDDVDQMMDKVLETMSITVMEHI
jgi:hypothetical protein